MLSSQNQVNLATLLNPAKILPHYERISTKVATGGGDSKYSSSYCGRISLVRKL